MHILDPVEQDFDFTGRVYLVGKEKEDPLLVPNVEDIAAAYQQRMQAHKDRLAAAARRVGWSVITHVTDKPYHDTMLQLTGRIVASRGWA